MLEDKIRDFFSENGIYFTERHNAFTVACPNCGKNKLDISKEHGNYICYKCADTNRTRGPNVEFILQELTGKTIREITRFIRGSQRLADLDLGKMYGKQVEQVIIDEALEDDTFVVPSDFINLNDEKAIDGKNYLQNLRGVPEWLASALDIKYSPKYKQIIFLIYDGAKCVGYQGRATYGKIKYNKVKKSKYLMFEKTIKDDRVILAEGPISALKFAKSGIGFVASMGKSISEEQINRLKNKGVKKIYLALDRDAWKEVEVFYKKYYKDFAIYCVDVPEHRDDFGDCDFDEATKAVTEACRLTNMHSLPNWEK